MWQPAQCALYKDAPAATCCREYQRSITGAPADAALSVHRASGSFESCSQAAIANPASAIQIHFLILPIPLLQAGLEPGALSHGNHPA
jgi:hypothetical protein